MQPAAQAALRRAWLKQEQARYQHAVTANPQQASAWRKLSQIQRWIRRWRCSRMTIPCCWIGRWSVCI